MKMNNKQIRIDLVGRRLQGEFAEFIGISVNSLRLKLKSERQRNNLYYQYKGFLKNKGIDIESSLEKEIKEELNSLKNKNHEYVGLMIGQAMDGGIKIDTTYIDEKDESTLEEYRCKGWIISESK